MTVVGPCDNNMPIETLLKLADQLRNNLRNIYSRTVDKQTHSVLCLIHMLEAARIPSFNELSEDENGNKIISDIDPESLFMTSR